MAENTNPNPIRFGIMGCALIARKLARAFTLAPNAVVTAVGSRSLDKARRFIADNDLPDSVKAHGSYEGVLEDPDVDAVYIPLPTGLHVRWAVEAAEKGKHVLLEKPTAFCVADLDRILEACRSNGVQFMDTIMWVHHPRTAKMKELLSDPNRFGQLRTVMSTFTFPGNPEFFEGNIRVNPELDGLGALGDLGWYCIQSSLWATDYRLPSKAVALPNAVLNSAGVILSCSFSLIWDDADNAVATCHSNFMTHLSTELTVMGTRGILHLSDYAVPFEETSARFSFCTDGWFTDRILGWNPKPGEHVVDAELPQEAMMVSEFARLVGGIKGSGMKPESKWPEMTRKTQLVLDAVKASIEKGFVPVEIVA